MKNIFSKHVPPCTDIFSVSKSFLCYASTHGRLVMLPLKKMCKKFSVLRIRLNLKKKETHPKKPPPQTRKTSALAISPGLETLSLRNQVPKKSFCLQEHAQGSLQELLSCTAQIYTKSKGGQRKPVTSFIG